MKARKPSSTKITQYWWLLIIALIALAVFWPVFKFNITLQDIEVFYFINYHFGSGPLLLKFPLSYYFSQYGTLYITIDIIHQIFKYHSILYYIFNIALRILSAFSIYFLSKKWTSSTLAAFFSALTFTAAYPGLESTTWPTQFLAYVGVIMMCAYLLIWKNFHNNPTKKLAKISVIFFSLTIFISHIRVFALPFVIFPFEFYYLLKNRNRKYLQLKILHLVSLIIVFVVFYFFTDVMKATPELAGKITQPLIFAKSLLTGYPPTLASLFLFVSFILPSYHVVSFANDLKIIPLNTNFMFLATFFLSTFSTIIGLIFLVKRKIKIFTGITLAIIYPFALYFVGKELLSEGWPQLWLISTLFGGEILIFIFLDIFVISKHNIYYLEIMALGVLIFSLHLFLHWISVPLLEFNDQAAYSFFSRYYTVPVSGMSIVVGSYIALTINQIKNIHKKRNIFLTGVGILFITTIFVSYIGNISQITNQLSDIENNRNNVNYLRLWNTLQPYLNSIVVRDKKIVFYYEGSGTAEETKILTDYFPYRMAEEMSYTNGNGPTAAFINSKQTVLTIIKTEKLDPNQIYAFKIENGNVKDIKKDVLNEIAK